MTDTLPIAATSTPDGATFAQRLGIQLYDLEVVEGVTLTPSMRRVVLRADGLDRFSHQPGQDVMLAFASASGAIVRRRFTIRAHDAATKTIAVHVVTHGKGPGSRWALTAAPGSHIEGMAPRGKVVVVPDAAFHLFVGDETFLPASVAMIESLPQGARALFVALVGSAEDERPVRTPAALTGPVWVHRGAAASSILDAITALALPEGAGQAYVGGEAKLVRAVKDALVRRGFAADRIASKAYWRDDQSNAKHGEPDKDV